MIPLVLTLVWFVTGYGLAQWTLLLNWRKDGMENDSACVMALLFFAVVLSFFGPLWIIELVVEKRRARVWWQRECVNKRFTSEQAYNTLLCWATIAGLLIALILDCCFNPN